MSGSAVLIHNQKESMTTIMSASKNTFIGYHKRTYGHNGFHVFMHYGIDYMCSIAINTRTKPNTIELYVDLLWTNQPE